MDEPSNFRYDLIIDALVIIGVTINVYLILDGASDGALSRSVCEAGKRSLRSASAAYGTVKDRAKVLHHATNIVEKEIL